MGRFAVLRGCSWQHASMTQLTIACLGVVTLCLVGCANLDEAPTLAAPPSAMPVSDGALAQSIGIETLGGVFTPLLAKGCGLPCSLSQTFSTAEDGQDQIRIHMLLGDADRVDATESLGTFQISGVPALPRGEPSIRVDFRAGPDGITLRAVDSSDGSRLPIARVGP